LLRSTDYVSALQDTLLRGGDTDTNACIVGGMIGALHGLDAIPADMRMAVLNRSADSPGNRRPDFLQPVDLLNRIQRLYAPL
jgi:ADP-ribosylglycohydrolase